MQMQPNGLLGLQSSPQEAGAVDGWYNHAPLNVQMLMNEHLSRSLGSISKKNANRVTFISI